MAKVVIVEGVDRVGKSTFIKKLVEKHPEFKAFKHKPSDFHYQDMDNENETDKMLQLLEMVKLLDGNVVFDRFHISNMVYGFIDRHYDPFTAMKSMDDIEERIKELFGLDNVVLVYIKPEDVVKSSKEHGKDLSDYDLGMDCSVLDSILHVMVGCYSILDEMVDVLFEEFFDESGEGKEEEE